MPKKPKALVAMNEINLQMWRVFLVAWGKMRWSEPHLLSLVPYLRKKTITFPISHKTWFRGKWGAPLKTEGHLPGPHFPLNHDYGRKKRSRKEINGKLHCHKPPNMKMSDVWFSPRESDETQCLKGAVWAVNLHLPSSSRWHLARSSPPTKGVYGIYVLGSGNPK